MSNTNYSKKKIDKNFLRIIKLLTDNKINYWVCHGSLLGIIRDKNLIPWDHDIDIGVIENKKNRMILPIILKKGGFKQNKDSFFKDDGLMKFTRSGGRQVDVNFYRIDSTFKNAYVKWYVPKNIIMKIVDALSFAKTFNGNGSKIINFFGFLEELFLFIKKILIKKNFFYSSAGYSHNKKYAMVTRVFEFYKLKIIIPDDYKGYLEHLYGKKWRYPIRKFNWIKHSPSTIIINDN